MCSHEQVNLFVMPENGKTARRRLQALFVVGFKLVLDRLIELLPCHLE